MLTLRRLRVDHPRKSTRPKISAAKPKRWNRPLAEGVLPAYDEALKLIKDDSSRMKKEAENIGNTLANAEGARNIDENTLNALRERLKIIKVQSGINLPNVRWLCANGMADFSNPIHRHLLEQRWREEGTLDLLMERIHQMCIVPDVLPVLRPTFDLSVAFPITQHHLRSQELRKRRYQNVQPGEYLRPEQTLNAPKLYANVFHTDTRLYTLLMVDPDVPDQQNRGYQTYVHWLQPNIPLSASTSGQIRPNPHTPYIAPHPQRGTPYHRYVILLLPQPSALVNLSIPVLLERDRLGFNVRQFMDQHQLDGGLGGGAHVWREVWNDKVSDIYKDILKVEEPRFRRLEQYTV